MRVQLDQAQLEALATSPEVQRALLHVAQVAADSARRRVPVDTGRLKGSISADSEPGRAAVYANTDYAVYVERGTRRMAAQPYLWPAVDEAGGSLR